MWRGQIAQGNSEGTDILFVFPIYLLLNSIYDRSSIESVIR